MIIKRPLTPRNARLALFFLVAWLIVTVVAWLTWPVSLVVTPETAFSDQGVNVELQAGLTWGKTAVRYTLDGSLPTPESSIYTAPLALDKTTVVRAAVFRGQDQISPTQTHTYFMGTDHQLPVVSLVSDPHNLWDPETGIYLKYEERGSAWERPAEFLFYQDQEERYQQSAGIRIQGGGSREIPQKTFRLDASYQNPWQRFSYPFFDDTPLQSFETLTLRNAGTDWNYAYLRDALAHRLVLQTGQTDALAAQPVALYLNGQYWGLYYLRERYDSHYFSQKYGLDAGKLTFMEVPQDVGNSRGAAVLDEGKPSEVATYNQLLEAAARGCTTCATYNHYRQFLALSNFIDYNIYEIHFANFDWPFGNSRIWNYDNPLTDQHPAIAPNFPPGYDGRYRWLLYDLDVGLGFSSTDSASIRQSAYDGKYGRLLDDRFPFGNLFNDPTFQENYLNHYANLLNTNLSQANTLATLDELVAQLATEMPRQIERWRSEVSPGGLQQFQSLEDWQHEIELIRIYLEHRTDAMRQNTLEYFYPESETPFSMIELTLDTNLPDAGNIQVHRTTFAGAEAPHHNQYFPQQFINITALPEPGYRFSHWQGEVAPAKQTDASIRIFLDRDQQLTAHFEKVLPF